MNSTFDELLDLLDIPHTKGSGWYDDKKLKVEQLLERQQLLQQTQCTMLRELLEQKLSREYAARDFAIRANAMVQQHRANARIDLLQQLIDACKPVA